MSPQPPQQRRVATMFGLVMLFQIAIATGYFSFPALSHFIMEELTLDATALGMLSLVLSLIGLPTGVVAGWLTDRWGERLLMSMSGLLLAVGLVILWQASSLASVTAGLALFGLAYSAVPAATNRSVAQYFSSRNRSLFMSLKQSGSTIGQALASGTLPTLAIAASWRGTEGVMALVSIAAAAAIFLVYRDGDALPRPMPRDRSAVATLPAAAVAPPSAAAVAPPSAAAVAPPSAAAVAPPSAAAAPRAAEPAFTMPPIPATAAPSAISVGYLWQWFAGGQVWLAFLCAAALWLAQGTLTIFLIPAGIDMFQFDVVQAGLSLTLAQVCGALGRPLLGAISDRVQARIPVMAVTAVLAGLFVLLLLRGPAWTRWPAMALIGFTVFGWLGVYFTFVTESMGVARAGLATGISSLLGGFGFGVGPLLFGLIADTRGYASAVQFVSILLLTVGLFAVAHLSVAGVRRSTPTSSTRSAG